MLLALPARGGDRGIKAPQQVPPHCLRIEANGQRLAYAEQASVAVENGLDRLPVRGRQLLAAPQPLALFVRHLLQAGELLGEGLSHRSPRLPRPPAPGPLPTPPARCPESCP